MTNAEHPTDQQRRLAELQARRPKAKRRHPAQVARIAVLGLSTTAMFGLVARLGTDANAQTVTATGDVSTGQAATAAPAQASATATGPQAAEAAIDAELAKATLVTAPPVRVTVPPVGATGSTNSSSGSSATPGASAYPTDRATPIVAAPAPPPAPVRTNGSN